MRRPTRREAKTGRSRNLALSEARAQLSPIVAGVSGSLTAKVGISVRGQVRAYVVSRERLERLERLDAGQARHATPPTLRGTLQLGPETSARGTASAALERAALTNWDRASRVRR